MISPESEFWTEEHRANSKPDFYGKWVKCEDRIPELKDDLVIVYFSKTDSVEMVHIEDYLKDITSGLDDDGKQLYTKWYLSQGVTDWMKKPCRPDQLIQNEDQQELFTGTNEALNGLTVIKC